MDEEQLKLPPAKSLINEISLLHDQMMGLVEEQRETNRKLTALLANRRTPIAP
jgi:hypothetical protein